MDFKLVSKNNIGTAVLLLLVITLSQARAFNFLIDTALGRFFLIIFLLYLSYCNKILGVIGVLFIIIMFNSNVYHEGFTPAQAAAQAAAEAEAARAATQSVAETSAKLMTAETAVRTARTNVDAASIKVIEETNKLNQAKTKAAQANTPQTRAIAAVIIQRTQQAIETAEKAKIKAVDALKVAEENREKAAKALEEAKAREAAKAQAPIAVEVSPTSENKATEGFDILGIENNIRRGKQSNSIPVNNLMREFNDVSPYEGISFFENLSPFNF
jgi:hypothetical protein